MKTRLFYIDNLKGFLILLVILGHCIQSTDMDFDHNIIFRYIYSFHMPLFMCVSGFVSYKPQMTWGMVKRRLMQLMVPFFAWVLIGCCIYLDFSYLLDKILHPDTGLWFLWVLFFIVCALKPCEVIADKTKLRMELVVTIVCIILMGLMVALKIKLFGFQFIAWYFLFYCLGYFCKKYFHQLEQPLRSVQWPMLILFMVMAFFWMRKESPAFISTSSNIIYGYTYKFATAIVVLTALYLEIILM